MGDYILNVGYQIGQKILNGSAPLVIFGFLQVALENESVLLWVPKLESRTARNFFSTKVMETAFF